MKGFDLATLDRNDTATVPFLHPTTGEETGVTITVYGEDSETGKAATRHMIDKIGEYSRKNRGKAMPTEEVERLDRAKMAKVTKSIDGLTYGGKVLTDVAEIFNLSPDIYEQAAAAYRDRALFIKASSAK